mgnify:CR=1 FL=1
MTTDRSTVLNEPLILWGTPHSLYTGKVRSYLIKKGVPYREFYASHPDFQARIRPVVGLGVTPVLETPDGVIDAPIGRDPKRRKRMAVVHDGREAVTEFRVVELFANFSLLDVFPKTGRTHQIRVHAAHAGHPVAGDVKYGNRIFNDIFKDYGLKRMFLHSSSLGFTRPGTREPMLASAPLPPELYTLVERIDIKEVS